MPVSCIFPNQVEKLKEAFRKEKIDISSLYKLSSQERVDLFAKYLGGGKEGIERSKKFVSKLEGANLRVDYKRAISRVIEREVIGRGKLYADISVESALELSKNYSMSSLEKDFISKGMDVNGLAEILYEYVGDSSMKHETRLKKAEAIANKYFIAKKEGKLADWEQRVFGTKELRNLAKSKGQLAKLDTLNDIGALTETEIEGFMQTYAEDKLGFAVSAEQAAVLSSYIETANESLTKLLNKVEENKHSNKNEWSGEERIEYEKAREELEQKINDIKGSPNLANTINNLISINRNAMLASPKNIVNSSFFQFLPTLAQRISSKMSPKDFSSGEKVEVLTKLGVNTKTIPKVEGFDVVDFILQEIKTTMKIYDLTGKDISRSVALEGDRTIFTDDVSVRNIPTTSDPRVKALKKEGKHKEAKILADRLKRDRKRIRKDKRSGMSVLGKVGESVSYAISEVAAVTSLGPKWMAGTTDVMMAAAIRASTTVELAKATAEVEFKNNKLPEGMTKEQRMIYLIKESMSPITTDEVALEIRGAAVEDAKKVNNTHEIPVVKFLETVRKGLNIKGVKLGNIITPFFRIGATANLDAVRYSVPLVSPLVNLGKIGQIKYGKKYNGETNVKKAAMIRNEVTDMVKAVGFQIAALALAHGIIKKEDEEGLPHYIPPYMLLTENERKIAESLGARPNSIRIGEYWLPLSYFPQLSIPFSVRYELFRSQNRNEDIYESVNKGLFAMVAAITETPVIKEAYEIAINVNRSSRNENFYELLTRQGLDKEALFGRAAYDLLPSFITRDIANAIYERDTRYDFLGNEIDNITAKNPLLYYSSLRNFKSRELIVEFSRLDKAGYAPVISEPSHKHVEALKEILGEKDALVYINEVKRQNAEKAYKLTQTAEYKKMTDSDKKSAIDKIRRDLMSGDDWRKNQFLKKIQESLSKDEWEKFKKDNKIKHYLL